MGIGKATSCLWTAGNGGKTPQFVAIYKFFFFFKSILRLFKQSCPSGFCWLFPTHPFIVRLFLLLQTIRFMVGVNVLGLPCAPGLHSQIFLQGSGQFLGPPHPPAVAEGAPCTSAFSTEVISPPCPRYNSEADVKTLLCKHPETASAPTREAKQKKRESKAYLLAGELSAQRNYATCPRSQRKPSAETGAAVGSSSLRVNSFSQPGWGCPHGSEPHENSGSILTERDALGLFEIASIIA